MKELFYYVFYRVSKFYRSWGESKNYYISGKFSLLLALSANILTLICLFCLILKIRYNIKIIYGIWFLLFISSFFILNEKKYEELEKKYINLQNQEFIKTNHHGKNSKSYI